MKRIARQFTYPISLVVAVVLLAFMVFTGPSPSRAASSEQGTAKAGKTSKVEHVEARIKELQARLKITPTQKEQWNNVTQVMRDNAKTMDALVKERAEHIDTMNAVDDLKSYGEVVQEHADGIKKFIAAFEPLYTSMSDAQKADADKLFRYHGPEKKRAKGK